jgi:hypothetical protein
LITVVIYHFENRGIVRPAIPLSVLWGTTTLTTLYYTTSTHDISHEIYLVSSLLMFMLEWASPRTPIESVSFKEKSLPFFRFILFIYFIYLIRPPQSPELRKVMLQLRLQKFLQKNLNIQNQNKNI